MPDDTKVQVNPDITAEDLSKISDPFGMAKEFLKSPKGAELLEEVRNIQKDLKGKKLKLEDHLIVGTKTLKEATKNWEKKGLDSEEKVALYAALYIGGCIKKEVPVTFICPRDGLKQTEKNFNDKNILEWGDEVKDTLWDKIWDAICFVLQINSPHSIEKANQEHRIKVDEIRTSNLRKAIKLETEKKYNEAKKIIKEVEKEEKKWEKLFLKEGAGKLPELPKELREKLPAFYKDMNPIEICMGLASKKVSFSDQMTPESVGNSTDTMNKFQEVGEMYRSLVKGGNVEQLTQELKKKALPMSFSEPGYAMQHAIDESRIGVAMEVEEGREVKRKANPEYNPLGDKKVREKMIQLAPMLKHLKYKVYLSEDKLTTGTLMAKEWYGLMEDSAKIYEAIKNNQTKAFLPLASKIAAHNAWYTYARNSVVEDHPIIKISVSDERRLDSLVGGGGYKNAVRNMGSNFDAIIEQDKLISPLGTAMMMAEYGLEGSIDKLNPDFNRERSHLIPETLNKVSSDALKEANKKYGEMEIQKAAEPQSKQMEEPIMDGPEL